MKEKGVRNPNAEHIRQQLIENQDVLEEGDWEVNQILRSRVHQGSVQYLVEWKGYEKLYWVNEQDLDAPELIEDWELANAEEDDNNKDT